MAFFRKSAKSGGGMIMVAGLGNPGEEYARTRHNAGFMVAGQFIRRQGLPRPRHRYAGRWVEGEALGHTVAVLMPQTFMNLSGDSIAEAAGKKHVSPQNIIVVHDDLDFPFGAVRCRQGGGTGGHNGLESIVARLGSRDFNRVRVGIGRPDDRAVNPRDWVLGPFDQSEEELSRVIGVAVDCVETIIAYGIEEAMRRFNRRENGQ